MSTIQDHRILLRQHTPAMLPDLRLEYSQNDCPDSRESSIREDNACLQGWEQREAFRQLYVPREFLLWRQSVGQHTGSGIKVAGSGDGSNQHGSIKSEPMIRKYACKSCIAIGDNVALADKACSCTRELFVADDQALIIRNGTVTDPHRTFCVLDCAGLTARRLGRS